jgi:hypothetical protein
MLYIDRITAELPLGIRRPLLMKVGGSGWHRVGDVRRTPEGVEVLGDTWEPLWDNSAPDKAQSWVGVHRAGGGVLVIGTSSRRLRWPRGRRAGGGPGPLRSTWREPR